MRHLPVLPADVPTASRIGLALRCVYPWTSGQRPSHPATWGDEARLGTMVHAAAEAATRGEDTVVDMTGLPPDKQVMAWDIIEVVRAFIEEERERPHLLYEAERAVEIDLLTGAGCELPAQRHRDYTNRSPHGVAGTIDHLLWPEGGMLTVRDWKTGAQRGMAHEAARMQTRTLATAVAALYEVDEMVAEVATIATDGVSIEREVLTAAALDAHMDALWALAQRLGAGPQPPMPGPWCTEMFCPLLGECPASRGALAAISREDPILRIADEATALRVIDGLPRAEAALEAIRAALDVYIRHSPPEGPDGRLYGIQDHEVRALDISTPGRIAALEQVLGEHVDVAVEVKRSTSIKAIERAARARLTAQKKRRGIGELRDEALAALDKAGGLRTRTYQRAAWFWPEGARPEAEETALLDDLFGRAD